MIFYPQTKDAYQVFHKESSFHLDPAKQMLFLIE